MTRLLETYREKLVPELTKRFGYKSVMEVPRITKITLNMGVGLGRLRFLPDGDKQPRGGLRRLRRQPRSDARAARGHRDLLRADRRTTDRKSVV